MEEFENRCPECGEETFALTGRSTYEETSTKRGRKILHSYETKAECKNGHQWVIDSGEEETTKPPRTALTPSP